MQQRLSGVDFEFSLAWLLHPISVETFLAEIWAKTHYHVARHCADYFETVLPGPSLTEDLVAVFCQESSALRLMRETDKKGADSYRLDDGSLDLAGIRNDFADGYTIVLDGVERHIRAIAALSQSIEVELNFPVQVNAYITPPRSQGLVPHYDDHDVLILQIQGSKTWHIYEGADVPPREIQREKDKAVAIEDLPSPIDVQLEAGDVLYLPRGKVHEAETNSEPSIHLTVGVHAPTALMLAIGALYAQSFHDDRLNARLPPRHLDDADQRAALEALMRDTVKTVEDPSALARGLDTLADVLVRRGRCPPVGPILNAVGIDGQTLVRKYQPLYSSVKAEPGGVTLQFASLSVGAGPDHKAAMEFVSRSTEPFRVGDLPELSERQQIELTRSLIVSGFLVRLEDG
ncbi:MAG: cupin domain-containing protein [Mycobacterium sp.]|uniref:cupin domain-containing protein n=1 Tax=Mycobacterium sp. TaxID=1785 RepID=UPI003C73AD18